MKRWAIIIIIIKTLSDGDPVTAVRRNWRVCIPQVWRSWIGCSFLSNRSGRMTASDDLTGCQVSINQSINQSIKGCVLYKSHFVSQSINQSMSGRVISCNNQSINRHITRCSYRWTYGHSVVFLLLGSKFNWKFFGKFRRSENFLSLFSQENAGKRSPPSSSPPPSYSSTSTLLFFTSGAVIGCP